MANPLPASLPKPITRRLWLPLAFLLISAATIFIVSKWYLIPAMDSFNHADAKGKRLLGVQALLLMCVVLCFLGFMLVLTFRVGRFFFPRAGESKVQTKYVDAWAESGKRMKTPPEEKE